MDVDYYFSLASPYTYLGHGRFEALALQYGAEVRYRPADGGKVFAAAGTLALKDRPRQRQAYRMMELRRWRKRLGIELNLEPAHFPAPDGEAMRTVAAAILAGRPPGPLIGGFLSAVWTGERNIADPATIHAIVTEAALDADALTSAAASDAVRDLIDANSARAIKDGVFGMPTWKIGDELFWGQDRLDFLEEALRG